MTEDTVYDNSDCFSTYFPCLFVCLFIPPIFSFPLPRVTKLERDNRRKHPYHNTEVCQNKQ